MSVFWLSLLDVETCNFYNRHEVRAKRKVFLLITLLTPISFFVLLELALRLFNYGDQSQPMFISDPFDPEYSIMNPAVAQRYFPVKEFAPVAQYDLFETEKSSTTFRVFVQGASTAAGFPYHNATFPRLLEQKLQYFYPERNIEVVNTSLVATNSFTLLDLSDEILDQKPDAIIIYSGHNEFYGALGVASSQSFGNSPLLTNLYLKLKNVKTIQLVKNIVKSFYTVNEKGDSETLMAKMVKDESIPYDSKLHKAGAVQYEFNISSLLEKYDQADIPVYICTLVSNYRDFQPFESTESGGANDFFNEGLTALKNGDIKKAKELFELARDHDLLKFRATSEIEKLVPMLAEKYGAQVVDIKKAFDDSSIDGIVGNDLLNEHVHPNLKGQRILSNELFLALESLLSSEVEKTKKDDFEYAIASVDSLYGSLMINQLLLDWPFTDVAYAEESENGATSVNKVLSGETPWVEVLTKSIYADLETNPEQALSTAKVLLQELHNQIQPHLLVAQAYNQLGDHASAEALLKNLKPILQGVEALKYRLTNSIDAGDFAGALGIANELLQINKNDVSSSRTKIALEAILKIDLGITDKLLLNREAKLYLDAMEGLIFIQRKDYAETLRVKLVSVLEENQRFIELSRRMTL